MKNAVKQMYGNCGTQLPSKKTVEAVTDMAPMDRMEPMQAVCADLMSCDGKN